MQDLEIKKRVTLYRREQYELEDGSYFIAPLPPGVKGHFGDGLKEYIIHQSFGNNVSQKKLHRELEDRGLSISSGMINNIALGIADVCAEEYQEVARAGIATAEELRVDDTGAYHKGKSWASLVIQNDNFTYFKTSNSKSRMSFLDALRAYRPDFVINDLAIEYVKQFNPKPEILHKLQGIKNIIAANEGEWKELLQKADISTYNTGFEPLKRINEAALYGSAIMHGMDPSVVMLSDGASQYNIGKHALCWIHAERAIKKLVPINKKETAEINLILDQYKLYYQDLKKFRINPSIEQKQILSNQFDTIFNQPVNNYRLTSILKNFMKSKEDLLRVLDYPFIHLHNNSSELDIRKLVMKRKVSGGTRSDQGLLARDTMISLFTTARKHKISVLGYINDRLTGKNKIPYLPDLIRQKTNSGSPPIQ